ncbi:MAG: hypothetical protein QMD09_01870 [Desulfatibacillaceae bacterium]|nr:hypothetical protein [Desulfatibacillaceae bacterium]
MKRKIIPVFALLLVLSVVAAGCGPAKYRHIHTGKVAGTDDPEFAQIYAKCEAQAQTNCPDCRMAASRPPRGGSSGAFPDGQPIGSDYQALCQECLNREISQCLKAAGWVPSR